MIGHSVKMLMASRGWGPGQLAAQSGLRLAVVESIIAGTSEGTTAQQMRLARALGVDALSLTQLPAPGVENHPLWHEIREVLNGFGPKDIHDYLVVMRNALGREEARVKQQMRKVGA